MNIESLNQQVKLLAKFYDLSKLVIVYGNYDLTKNVIVKLVTKYLETSFN